jgi:hypothetical protein
VTLLRPSVLAAGVAAAALAAAGCSAGPGGTAGGARHAGAGAPTAAAGSSPTTAASGGSSATTGATGSAGGSSPTTVGAPACSATSLRATLDVQPAGAGGSERALLVATNSGPSQCSVDGYAGLSGQPGGARIVHIDLSAPARPVPLAGGASAFAAAEWTAAPSCPAVATLTLSVPGSAGRAQIDIDVPGGTAEPLHLCSGGVEVGPFEATAMAARFPAPAGPTLAACRTGDMTGSLVVSPSAPKAASAAGRLVLTNRGRRDCETGGYVGVRLLGAGGSRSSAAAADGPAGSSTPVDVGAGQSVSATVRFSAGSAGARRSCDRRAVTVEVTLPGQRSALTVRGPQERLCRGGTVAVGALQAGAGG